MVVFQADGNELDEGIIGWFEGGLMVMLVLLELVLVLVLGMFPMF